MATAPTFLNTLKWPIERTEFKVEIARDFLRGYVISLYEGKEKLSGQELPSEDAVFDRCVFKRSSDVEHTRVWVSNTSDEDKKAVIISINTGTKKMWACLVTEFLANQLKDHQPSFQTLEAKDFALETKDPALVWETSEPRETPFDNHAGDGLQSTKTSIGTVVDWTATHVANIWWGKFVMLVSAYKVIQIFGSLMTSALGATYSSILQPGWKISVDTLGYPFSAILATTGVIEFINACFPRLKINEKITANISWPGTAFALGAMVVMNEIADAYLKGA